LAALAVACGESAVHHPPALVVQPSQPSVPADGVTTVDVVISNVQAGPVTIMAELGVLATASGQSGSKVVLPGNGTVTLRSPCDARAAEGCWGQSMVTAHDGALSYGATRVSLSCPGTSCMAKYAGTGVPPPIGPVSGGSGSNGGGGGKGPCTGALDSICTTSSSGWELHVADGSGGENIFSNTDDTLYTDTLTNVTFSYDPGYLVFIGDADLTVKSYSDAGSGQPPFLSTDVLTCSSPVGGFSVKKLTRDTSDALTEFQATFQQQCPSAKDQYVCGCVHWVHP